MGLETVSIVELEFRAGLCDKIAREARAAGNPQCEEAIRQQGLLNDERAKRIRHLRGSGSIQPPPEIIVGLQSIDVKARGKRPISG